jgi:nucleotide-binding universal stress UspA family protein
MIKSLLVAVDSSASARAALEHAVGLARACQGRVTGVNVIAPLDVMQKFQEKGERILGDVRKTAEAAGIAVDVRLEEGVPGQVIADLAKGHDLVVLGKRGEHAKWGRDLLGSTAEAVTKRSAVPVLLVEEQPRPLVKALAMVDGSVPAERALRLASELAGSVPLQLTVLTAQDDEKEGQAVLASARTYLETAGLAGTYVLLPGRPAKAAATALADAPIDLVIMGMRGHSVLHDLILGRTTEQVMRSAKVPVLLVP